MKARKTLGLFFLVLTILVFVLLPNQAFADIINKFLIYSSPGTIHSYDVSGNIVVWSDDSANPRPGGNRLATDIYGYNLSTDSKFTISSAAAPSEQIWPKISGNYVVWQDGRNPSYDIYSYRLGRGEMGVCTTPSSQTRPVVAVDTKGSNPIYAFFDDNKITVMSAATGYLPSYIYQMKGSYSGVIDMTYDTVVWWDSNVYIIYGYNLMEKKVFTISTGSWVAIDGNIVVASDYRDGKHVIFSFDLAAPTGVIPKSIIRECNTPSCVLSPAISGDIVVWKEFTGLPPIGTGTWNICGYNLTTAEFFTIETSLLHPEGLYSQGMSSPFIPAIDGNLVVWAERNSLYGAIVPEPATLFLVLPAALLLFRMRKRETK